MEYLQSMLDKSRQIAFNSLQIQCNPYQITNDIFTELEQIIKKFVQKHKTPQIAKTILRNKNGAEGLMFPVYSSIQFSCSVVSDSFRPPELQHTRTPCPSSTPGVYSNSCPSSQGCQPTSSSSVIPFSSRLQSFPTSGSFQMSQLFTLGGQNIGVSASTSVLPMNTQD